MVQELLASRITLTPRPVQPRPAALEVAFLGHCPGRVRLERLLGMPQLLEELRANGFIEQVENLLSGIASESLLALEHLPLPLRSSAEFHDLFPDAATAPCQYRSILAGNKAWLPASVDDYFANGGVKLWTVKIPETEQQAGFFPAQDTKLHDVRSLRGLATLMIINSIGSVAFPDLERLQVPANLPDVPRVQLDNPDPQFLPCGTLEEDDHRERRSQSEMPTAIDTLEFSQILRNLLTLPGKHRPDWQMIFTMPLAYSTNLNTPCLDTVASETLHQIKQSESASRLRQIQLVFPYLRGPASRLRTGVGALAGKQANAAERIGIWSSVAEQALSINARPYPALSIAETVKLRKAPGISIMRYSRERVRFDDERLAVPALPGNDIKTSVNDARYDGYRSAEVQRLMGFLQRALQALGEQIIFNMDYRDPRPRLLLNNYFNTLYKRGALRGASAKEAFTITQIPSYEGHMVFEIEIAPALPIETIHLTFNNIDGRWNGGLSLG
ncbi:hypothetical protein TDB9533_03143 [Thalassocella blandensis]|nr:hypothetical protein TDB9533_03143 [Thalassocella blandensis]